ncbi:MAG: hypothetical protein QM820_36875 [Minicystis sp.]
MLAVPRMARGPGFDHEALAAPAITGLRALRGVAQRGEMIVLVGVEARVGELEPVGLLVGDVDRPDDVDDLLAVHVTANHDLGAGAARVGRGAALGVMIDAKARGLTLESAVRVADVVAGDGRLFGAGDDG